MMRAAIRGLRACVDWTRAARGTRAARLPARVSMVVLGFGLLLVLPVAGRAAELHVISGGAAKAAVAPLTEAFASSQGVSVKLEFAPMGVIAQRLARGDVFDVLIMTPEALKGVREQGRLAATPALSLARVGIGVAVHEDSPLPDISTVAALRATLLNARSVVYIDPRIGTSGAYVVEAFDRMGIRDAMAAKSVLGTGGEVVEPVGHGEIELGLHQITEILPVKGVRLVGELPRELQHYTDYVAAIGRDSAVPELARRLIDALRSESARSVYQRAGFVTP